MADAEARHTLLTKNVGASAEGPIVDQDFVVTPIMNDAWKIVREACGCWTEQRQIKWHGLGMVEIRTGKACRPEHNPFDYGLSKWDARRRKAAELATLATKRRKKATTGVDKRTAKAS